MLPVGADPLAELTGGGDSSAFPSSLPSHAAALATRASPDGSYTIAVVGVIEKLCPVPTSMAAGRGITLCSGTWLFAGVPGARVEELGPQAPTTTATPIDAASRRWFRMAV